MTPEEARTLALRKRAVEVARAWDAANPARVKANQLAHYAANREKLLAQSAAYQAAHPIDPEKRKSYRLRHYRDNREKILRKQAVYRAANADKINALVRARSKAHPEKQALWYAANFEKEKRRKARWYAENPEKSKAAGARRRAILIGATVGDPKIITLWWKQWRRLNQVSCYWCRRKVSPKQCHADHVVALVLGGSHDVGNLCVSCKRCNYKKNAKPLSEWNSRLAEPVLL